MFEPLEKLGDQIKLCQTWLSLGPSAAQKAVMGAESIFFFAVA